MKRKFFIWIIMLSLVNAMAFALQPHNQRKYYIPASKSNETLDSLSIIEESFEIYGPDGQPLNPALYSVDFMSAEISLRLPEFWHEDSLLVSYSVFPLNFSKPYFHKDTSWISMPGPGESFRPLTTSVSHGDKGLLDFPGINSSGSITRGITVGNRQDLSINSAMNLQLSGNLTDEIEVLAVISDQDIPLQPEGSTQQLQDFDRVFIQLSGYNGTLIAGDFEMEKPKGHFMNLSRKSQGGMITYKTPDDYESTSGAITDFDVSIAGAISKGIYARNSFNGMEGNQGPYRLSGNNAESYIIILAGTEKVYIDGELLIRGMDNHYIIDYNQAELTFTSKRRITDNCRIVVEFEYAARDYARSTYFASTGLGSKYGNLRINFFSEQDHPSQPLFRELTDEQINIMAMAGDSIHKALTWSFDSIGFKNDRVMYLLTDSLGYDTVFVHSTNPEKAHYIVNFSFVGEGKGNYRQISSAANGRVFQWIKPENGVPQGSHEPVQLLVTPQKTQMLTIAYDFNISENTHAGIEWALSNNDINLFSELDKANNTGYAILTNITNKTKLKKDGNWGLITRISYETANKRFRPVERYRSVEFDRDWNIGEIKKDEDEHYTQISLKLENKHHGSLQYDIGSFYIQDVFSGIKNSLNADLKNKHNRIFYKGSYLNAEGWQNSDFYRHDAGYTRTLKYFNLGAIHKIENNSVFNPEDDLLKPQSFSLNESEIFVSNRDDSDNDYRIFYKYRLNHFPVNGIFQKESEANAYGISYNNRVNPNQRFSINLTYNEVEYFLAENKNITNDNYLAGRMEYFSRWANGAITSSLFYEASSGMERKREYVYVEVPAGQGVYVWIDYNENGIMELDEFEIAQYPDEANFIRVFIPTDEFIKVYSNVYSQMLNIDPRLAWQNKKGIKGFLARFNNQASFSVSKKTQDEMTLQSFNPFHISMEDTLITSLNTSLRNSLFFNRISPVFAVELTWRDDRNKVLLSNGYETRQNEILSLSGRWNINRQYSINMTLAGGTRSVGSDFFAARNFMIKKHEAEPAFNIMLSRRLRIGIFYAYQQKNNIMGNSGEYSLTHKAGMDTRINFPGKASVSARFQLSQIEYPFDENTPLAFDMLESLKPGLNQIWNISWQQNLNEYLMLIFNYHGRNSPGASPVHTGNVQIRAFF